MFIYFLVNRAICRCSELTVDAVFPQGGSPKLPALKDINILFQNGKKMLM